MSAINERIIPLDELDSFEVAEGDPDVRGWHVYAGDGVRIGEVDELLVDTEALKVRYLDVELDEAEGGREERHVLIPVGFARLHETDDHILVDALDSVALTGLPAYAQEPLTREYEAAVLRLFQPASPPRAPADDPYAGDTYDQDRLYGSRRGRADG
jgi:photosynthetic reaction center H subunit